MSYLIIVLECLFLIKSKNKGHNSVKKRKGNSLLKCSVRIAQIILLHGFEVCINTVRLNRYVIKCNFHSSQHIVINSCTSALKIF